MADHPTHPTFDQFITQHMTQMNGIIAHHTWYLQPADREDIRQEILINFWKVWPTLDWKKNVVGLFAKIALRKTLDWVNYHRHKRRTSFKTCDEIAFGLDTEMWSLKEHEAQVRARKEPCAKVQPWVGELDEGDRLLIELARAIVRANGTAKCYMEFMAQWIPKGMGMDFISRWYKRMDNLKSRSVEDLTRRVKSNGFKHAPERRRMLKWCLKHMPKAIEKIETGWMPNTHDKKFMVIEAAIWKNKLYKLWRDRDRKTKPGASRSVKLPIDVLPDWIRDGDWKDPDTAFRICRWLRQRWKLIKSNVDTHGWLHWEETIRLKRNIRSRAWADENADHIKKMNLGRKEARNRSSREWNRRNREFCRMAHRRWMERKRASCGT